nr:uncharacterized protein LOC104113973 isoform X3 [Nicotiana tomentosiformis]
MSACLPKDPIPEIPFAPQLVQKPNTCEFIWTTVRVYEVLIICSPPLRCGLHFSVLPSFSDLLDFLSCFSCQLRQNWMEYMFSYLKEKDLMQ